MSRAAVAAVVALALAGARTAAAEPDAPASGFAVAGAHGFGLRGDGGFRLDLHAVLASDARAFASDLPPGVADRTTFALRAAALQLDATIHEHVRFLVLANLADPRPVTDAWVEYGWGDALRLRAGKFPLPISAERLTPPLSLPFVGSSASALLLPPRDTGVAASGAIAGVVDWNLAVTNGAVAGGPGDADTDGGKDVVARVFARPLGVGVGASWGRHRGTAAAPGTAVVRTYGAQPWFAYRADALADGDVVRVVPHALWARGPVGLQLDGVLAWEDVAGATVPVRAASAIATVALTGEDVVPLGFVVPRRPMTGATPGPGAILVVAGAGGVRVGDAAFDDVADPTTAMRAFTVIGGGLKWYPVAGIAVFADYGHQWFAAARGAPARATEDTVVVRLQVIL